MPVQISERAHNLLLMLIEDLAQDQLEYDEEDNGMPHCAYCKQSAVQPRSVRHTDNCLTMLAFELAKEIAKPTKGYMT